MGPAKFHDDHDQRCSRINAREINGHRPSPLKINKGSHSIHKSYSSSSSTQQQQRQPVIIYTHSPKIIHTQARDFMALVQKLTGISPSDDNNKIKHGTQQKQAEKLSMMKQQAVLTEEKQDGGSRGGGGADVYISSVSPITRPPTNPFLADIPLFTPTGTDFFCSPKSLFPNINPNSPSVFEFMKGLPEY